MKKKKASRPAKIKPVQTFKQYYRLLKKAAKVFRPYINREREIRLVDRKKFCMCPITSILRVKGGPRVWVKNVEHAEEILRMPHKVADVITAAADRGTMYFSVYSPFHRRKHLKILGLKEAA